MQKKSFDIIAVSSSGGHWEQLQLAIEKIEGSSILHVTTNQSLIDQRNLADSFIVTDCNSRRLLNVLKCTIQCTSLILKYRPQLVISTGAAPGIICIVIARIVGSKTVWIDSFANVERLSLSGKIARYFSHVWLTQWEHLSSANGPNYKGQLL